MGELMTKYMWYERHQEVIADSRRNVHEFTQRYKNAYVYCIFKNLRLNLISRQELPTLLMEQRKWANYNRPLITGSLHILKSNGPKKWQQVYCVLQPTYVLEVYGSEKAFECARKPVFTLHHEIYEVIDNIDAHLSEIIKAYLREFGYIMENVSHVTQKISSPAEATKRPSQHVISFYHKYKGSIYLAFDSALEKDKWLAYFRDAHRHLAGIHCDNDIQKRAFELAIKQACDAEEHCNLKIQTTGTQQQVLTYFITTYLSNGCKALLQTKVKGDVVKKYKIWTEISKSLYETVEAIVDEEYPALRRKAEEDAEGFTKQISSSLTHCNTVYNSISENIQDDMAEKFHDEMECKIHPHLPGIIETIERLVNATLEEVKSVFSSVTESLNEKVTSSSVEFANNIDTCFVKQMDHAPRSPEVMRSVFAATTSLQTQEREVLAKFPAIEYKDKLCILAQTLLDSSMLTFEVSCGDAVSKNNGFLEKAAISKVEAHVLKKFDHDSKVLTKTFLSSVINSAVCKTIFPSISQCLKNKMQSYQDLVPQEITHILLINQVFTETIADKVKEVLDAKDGSSFVSTLPNGSDEQTTKKQESASAEENGPSTSEVTEGAQTSSSIENITQATSPCVQDMETGEATSGDCFNSSEEEKPSD